jgi:hypothetical protein
MKQINKHDIHDIEWILNGKKVKVDAELLNKWQFIGLNNTDFPRYAFDKDSEAGKLFSRLLPPEEREEQ